MTRSDFSVKSMNSRTVSPCITEPVDEQSYTKHHDVAFPGHAIAWLMDRCSQYQDSQQPHMVELSAKPYQVV